MEIATSKMIMRTNVGFENGRLVFPEQNHSVDLLNIKPHKGEDSGFIFYSHTGKEICHISVRTDRRPCELTYGTVEEFRNQGYMQAAMKIVLQLFEENQVTEEISGLIYKNPTSEHILLKFGFVQSDNYQYGGSWYIRK